MENSFGNSGLSATRCSACPLSYKAFEPEKDIKTRIKQYKLVKEEQQLITDILTLRYDAAVIQAKFKPAQPAPQPVPPKVNE